MSVSVHPRFVFLMRHAEQRVGHLTESGSEHVGALAARLSEWILPAWRGNATWAVHLWCTTPGPKVQENAVVLAIAVREEMDRHKEPVGYPFRDRKYRTVASTVLSVDPAVRRWSCAVVDRGRRQA